MRGTLLAAAAGIVGIGAAVWAGPAVAHKLKVFAVAEGPVIAGYAYFNSGSRAQDARVVLAGPGSGAAPLATATTDASGAFRFEVGQRADHLVTVDGGDGHVASFTIRAAELPDTLPRPASGPEDAATSAATAPPLPETLPRDGDTLRTFIDGSIARQIRPLREQIDAYHEKVWLHDVLGGLGVIFGLCGIAFGLTANRRHGPQARERNASASGTASGRANR